MTIASVGSFGAKAIEIYFWHFSLDRHIYYTRGVHLNVRLHFLFVCLLPTDNTSFNYFSKGFETIADINSQSVGRFQIRSEISLLWS